MFIVTYHHTSWLWSIQYCMYCTYITIFYKFSNSWCFQTLSKQKTYSCLNCLDSHISRFALRQLFPPSPLVLTPSHPHCLLLLTHCFSCSLHTASPALKHCRLNTQWQSEGNALEYQYFLQKGGVLSGELSQKLITSNKNRLDSLPSVQF